MYITEIEEILKLIKTKPIMVLSTSYKDIITSRNMSVVTVDDKIYCQTDKKMVKAVQISKNDNVSLCADNIQITGKAKIIGKWTENEGTLLEYRKVHNNSYEKYRNVADEIVIEIKINTVKIWEYINQEPYTIEFDLTENNYVSTKYITGL